MNKLINANKFFGNNNMENNNIIIIADNISTPENIGSVIRLTDNIGAKKLFLINKIKPNKIKIKRNSSSAYNNVDFQFIDYEYLNTSFFNEYRFIAIDTVINSKNIYNFKFPKKVAFIIGNEKYGLSDNILNLCEDFIYIPIPGKTKSMNVSHALTVALFEYYRQQL